MYSLLIRTSKYVKQTLTYLKGIIDNNSMGLQCPTFDSGYMIQTLNQQGNIKFDQYIRPNRPEKYV